jgi:hypothetical protein
MVYFSAGAFLSQIQGKNRKKLYLTRLRSSQAGKRKESSNYSKKFQRLKRVGRGRMDREKWCLAVAGGEEC